MTDNPFSLAGRTALVTGSSRGLGLAIAEGLAAGGARRRPERRRCGRRLEEAAAALRGRGPRRARRAASTSPTRPPSSRPSRGFDADGIEIDILVNNAGIQFRKPMVELATADWRRVIDTNLTSAFVVGREAARRMIPRGRGKIINIGSLTSELARATVAPYTVAKGGIKMLTRAMAAEWAEHDIQANAIGPGYMLTDMNEALIDNPSSTPGSRAAPRRGAGASPRSWSAPPSSSPRRPPTTSTARSSTSTAA